MHDIIKEHKLEGQFRWLVALKDRVFNGELYRYIAGAGAAFRTAWSLQFAWHDAGWSTGAKFLATGALLLAMCITAYHMYVCVCDNTSFISAS